MGFDIHHYLHHPAPADPRLDQIIASLQSLKHQGAYLMATLQEALAADEAAEGKIIALLQNQSQQLTDLAQKLKDALASGGGTDQAAVQAVADQMIADAATMQAAADAAQPPPPAPPAA